MEQDLEEQLVIRQRLACLAAAFCGLALILAFGVFRDRPSQPAIGAGVVLALGAGIGISDHWEFHRRRRRDGGRS